MLPPWEEPRKAIRPICWPTSVLPRSGELLLEPSAQTPGAGLWSSAKQASRSPLTLLWEVFRTNPRRGGKPSKIQPARQM